MSNYSRRAQLAKAFSVMKDNLFTEVRSSFILVIHAYRSLRRSDASEKAIEYVLLATTDGFQSIPIVVDGGSLKAATGKDNLNDILEMNYKTTIHVHKYIPILHARTDVISQLDTPSLLLWVTDFSLPSNAAPSIDLTNVVDFCCEREILTWLLETQKRIPSLKPRHTRTAAISSRRQPARVSKLLDVIDKTCTDILNANINSLYGPTPDAIPDLPDPESGSDGEPEEISFAGQKRRDMDQGVHEATNKHPRAVDNFKMDTLWSQLQEFNYDKNGPAQHVPEIEDFSESDKEVEAEDALQRRMPTPNPRNAVNGGEKQRHHPPPTRPESQPLSQPLSQSQQRHDPSKKAKAEDDEFLSSSDSEYFSAGSGDESDIQDLCALEEEKKVDAIAVVTTAEDHLDSTENEEEEEDDPINDDPRQRWLGMNED
ncbi:hypothetical protein BCR43DRAFT_481910 [Syncephalastrum racemosum]|uniref:Uncharacterized protein n=1 Tax=Syncephalastrum racemosum TaxID=13706 RepID=A0A1X2HSS6_SYNRA|nr:hypothetical protein BCR43DRAFT_481910 [Syncephalastrum racemosum]